MYTFEPPICIPKTLCGEPSPVSTHQVFTKCPNSEEFEVPLGFLFGGFSSTAGYVPGNEAQRPKTRATFALIWLIISKERCPFLSEQLGSSEDKPSKPFGFSSERS